MIELHEIIASKIENSAKALIYRPKQLFPLTQTYEDEHGKVTVTYNRPNENGDIDVTVVREIKTVSIKLKYER